jgi:hypothetical protein
MGTTTAPLFLVGRMFLILRRFGLLVNVRSFCFDLSFCCANLTYSIFPGAQETVLRLAPPADRVGFVDVVEVGELVEVVHMAPVPLFKGANPIASFARSWSM